MNKSIGLELMQLNHCPSCASEERKHLFKIENSSLYECLSCNLRYLDPCLSDKEMKAAYESNETLEHLHDFHKGYYDYGDFSKESKTLIDFRRALELLEKCLSSVPSPHTILDVGFGNGFFLALAKQRGWNVAGIDPSQKNVALADQKFSLKLSCAGFEEFDSSGILYDAISFWDVIEHLPNPRATLKKAYQMLKPKGFLLVGIPNDRSLLSILSVLLYRLSAGTFKRGIETIYFLEHVAYYNFNTLQKLFTRSHFNLRNYFFTSTDLAKYSFSPVERVLAGAILSFGRVMRLQNRLVAIFQKNAVPIDFPA